jgi:HemY protein
MIAVIAIYPGHVHIEWLDYTIDCPIGLCVASVVVIFFIYTLIHKIWRKILKIPIIYQKFVLRKQRDKGQALLVDSISALFAGQPEEAKDLIHLCQEFIPGDSVLTHFLAQSALSLDDVQGAEKLYRQMLTHPRLSFLGAQGLYQCAKLEKNWKDAYEYALKAFLLRPDSPWVVKELSSATMMLDKINLIKDPPLKKSMSKKDFDVFCAARLWVQSRHILDDQKKMDGLKTIHQTCPQWIVPTYFYALLLEKYHKRDKAKKVLMASYELSPHRLLGHGWLKCDHPGDIHFLSALMPLISIHPKHFESLLLQAQSAFEEKDFNQLIPALKELYETNQKIEYLMLLEYAQKNPHGSMVNLVNPLEVERSFAWQCEKCYHASHHWDVICEECLSLYSFKWTDLSPRHPMTIPHIDDDTQHYLIGAHS